MTTSQDQRPERESAEIAFQVAEFLAEYFGIITDVWNYDLSRKDQRSMTKHTLTLSWRGINHKMPQEIVDIAMAPCPRCGLNWVRGDHNKCNPFPKIGESKAGRLP